MQTVDPSSIITLQESTEERSHDFTPRTFDDYLGQSALKEKLYIYTTAAQMRSEALDHLLLFGPPGLGKTTLSQIMAHVMHVGIRICSGPMLERTGDLVAILCSLEPRDIFFIDEIHRMPAAVEEVLYSAMEHFRVDVIIGQGAGAKSVNLPINPFTLVGATTQSGKISAPLRSRFGIVERLDFYEDSDLQHIVLQSAQFLQISIKQEAALAIAQAARGTPRIAKKIVRRIRDFAQVARQSLIDEPFVINSFNQLGMTREGLTKLDIKLLEYIAIQCDGGPVGLETLASVLSEDKETLEQVYEPFLIRKGYLEKTARGRQIPYKKLPFLKEQFLGQKSLL